MDRFPVACSLRATAPDGTLAHVSPIRPLAATLLITRVRRALPGAAFAVEYDGDFGHEPAYPTWSFGEEAAEPVGTAGELLTRIPGRPVLKILAYHPTLPFDDFYERARRTAGSSAETTYSTGLSLVEFSAPGVTKATTLDGTLVRTRRRAGADNRKNFSGKHKAHGLLFFALTDEKGNLIWISAAKPGRSSEITVARHNKITGHLREAGSGPWPTSASSAWTTIPMTR
jgi:hypothetical protein